MYNKDRLKKIVIQRHRRNKNLCILCGKDPHDGECEESYIKADMRDITIKKEVEKNKAKSKITPHKKATIIHYREEKKLCPKCGKELHEGDCIEDFSQSDNRTQEEKEFRPAVVTAPPRPTQEDAHNNAKINETILNMSPTKKIELYRGFIVINLTKSVINGYRIELSAINQLSMRFKDYILVLMGNIDEYFSYLDSMKLKVLTNITNVPFYTKQDMINYISSSKKYFSFYDDYIEYCKKNNILYYEFDNTKNVTMFLPQDAYSI